MIVNFLYNSILELVIFLSILIWFALGCTIVVPLLWNFELDYWNIKPFIKDIRSNKIN